MKAQMIMVPLSQEQVFLRAKEWANLQADRDKKIEAFNLVKDAHKRELDAMEERASVLAKQIREEAEERDAQEALPLDSGKPKKAATLNDDEPLSATVGEHLQSGDAEGDLTPATPVAERSNGKAKGKRGRPKKAKPVEADAMPHAEDVEAPEELVVGQAVYSEDEDEPLAEVD